MRVSIIIATTVTRLFLHEGVRYRHGCDDHDIHKERYDDDALIEADESIVLGKTVADKVRLDGLEEVPVECSVHDEV